MAVTSDLLERVLEPIGEALGREAAGKLLAIRVDPEVQSRIDELADRANEGHLTAQERSEYEALITASSILALLQAKARVLLAHG